MKKLNKYIIVGNKPISLPIGLEEIPIDSTELETLAGPFYNMTLFNYVNMARISKEEPLSSDNIKNLKEKGYGIFQEL